MEVLTCVVQSRRKVALLVFTLYASIATGLSGERSTGKSPRLGRQDHETSYI